MKFFFYLLTQGYPVACYGDELRKKNTSQCNQDCHVVLDKLGTPRNERAKPVCEAKNFVIPHLLAVRRGILGFAFHFFACLVFLSANLFASSLEKFDEANRVFSEGKYSDAIREYQAIMKEEGVSGELLYNLANAQLRAEQVGEAILNYERVLRLFSPHDPDVLANLKAARNEAGLTEFQASGWWNAAHGMTWNGWALVSIISLSFLCIFAGIRFLNFRAWWSRWILFVDVALILIFIFSVGGILVYWMEKDQAIVISEKAVVRISPFETAEVSFPVKQGEMVKVEKTYGDFLSVRNRIGKSGWIFKNQIEKIIP